MFEILTDMKDVKITWTQFIALVDSLCMRNGWSLKFDSENALSCVIFAQEPVSTDQLPLLLEGEDEPHQSH